jgi:hypothetical protein
MRKDASLTKKFLPHLLVAAILLSIASVYAQVQHLGPRFIRVHQTRMHTDMLNGTAGNPWQYRILADLMVEPVIRLLEGLDISRAETIAFIALRGAQTLLIFIAAGLYYRKLGLGLHANLIGLSILCWGMSYSLYNSDLSFNVYFDIFFYLLAAMLIMDGRSAWIIPLCILAAFNRETGVLIPVALAAHAYLRKSGQARLKPAITHAALGLILFIGILVGLRMYYGQQAFLTADGAYPGLGTLYLNLSRWITWEQLSITLGIIPILALLAWRAWPPSLRIFFWVVAPAWIGVHFLAALAAETRLLLVPQALVFIPGALFGITAGRASEEPLHTDKKSK